MPKKKRKPTAGRSRAPSAIRRSPVSAGRAVPPAYPGESALRVAVANRSRGIAVALSRQPGFVVPAAIVVLMVVGLAAPLAVAVPALLLIVVFMAWLAFLSWPVLGTGPRAMRLVAVAIVAAALVGRVGGWI